MTYNIKSKKNTKLVKQDNTVLFEHSFSSSSIQKTGIISLVSALFLGLLVSGSSALIYLGYPGPIVQYIVDNQLYEAVITLHAILMILFMSIATLTLSGLLEKGNYKFFLLYIKRVILFSIIARLMLNFVVYPGMLFIGLQQKDFFVLTSLLFVLLICLCAAISNNKLELVGKMVINIVIITLF